VEYFLKESCRTNITYFQVTGTPLQPCDHWYGRRLRNERSKLGFRAICDSSGLLCSKESFMTMDNISIMCPNLCYVTSEHELYVKYRFFVFVYY